VCYLLSDFSVIVRRFDSPIKIACIADVHYGALEHMEREWTNFVQMVLEDPTLFLVLDGDLINNNTRSSVGSPWDDTVRPREQKKRMVEMLTPIKDRILCCVSGNHERRSLKDADDDPTYDIMTKLDLEDVYRQNAAFMKIQLGQRANAPEKGAATYCFAVTHGAGGGIYTGATVNRNERWGNVIDGLDCLIVGHTHKGTVSRPSKIVFDAHNNKVTVKEYLVVSCVSWQNYGSYAMQKMLLPATTGKPQILHLSDKEKNIEVRW
jgi:DNA polymerase II small subunit/DNA polymerase delta subunit B